MKGDTGGSGNKRTEEGFGATGFFNHLDDTGFQLLNGRNVAGQNAHVARLSGNVDLDTIPMS